MKKKQIIVQALRAQLTTNKNKGAKINFANMSLHTYIHTYIHTLFVM